MAAETITVTYLLNKAWLLLVGVMWYSKKTQDIQNKERDEAISSLEKEVVEARAKYVTEIQVREAIREALEPYKEDQQEIKALLRTLNDQIFNLTKDMAVQTAIRSLSNDQQQNNGNR
jgi:hypothetical protein|tara:strand:- start:3000 stop:3353 length:354 start_codon:yes stop_codon:yes gene_type:complete